MVTEISHDPICVQNRAALRPGTFYYASRSVNIECKISSLYQRLHTNTHKIHEIYLFSSQEINCL